MQYHADVILFRNVVNFILECHSFLFKNSSFIVRSGTHKLSENFDGTEKKSNNVTMPRK